ncbi:MAG TPA: S53 family serine peptidase [Candidatus Baltobacteraceae bacterium]|nr:S53 family serine peptidase [Candidatus Baltobacteraceae bacterium]
MRSSSRAVAPALMLALALSACSGNSSSIPAAVNGNGIAPAAIAPGASLVSIPRTFGALAARDLGRRGGKEPVSVTIVLKYNRQADLERFIATQGAPHGPHHFLTAAQFNNRYAPTREQERVVVHALKRAGFAITQRFSNRTVIDASAPSSVVEKFFSTQMHSLDQGKYGQRFANVRPAIVPASIVSSVRTLSLSNLVIARPMIDFAKCNPHNGCPSPSPSPSPTATPTAQPTATPTPVPTSTPGGGCNGAAPDNGPLTNSTGTLATGVAKPFDFPVQHGCNGAGYTAAVVIDDPINTSYVATYLAASQVTQTGSITNVAVDGGGSGDDPETDLDVETISGLAPGANIIVYDIGSLTDQHIEDAYNKVLTDGTASAANSSFGGCESSDPSFETATNAIAQQGAAEGVEFSASSGDTGSNECGTTRPTKGVSAPAGDPYFTSIGGVNFTYNTSGVLTSVTMGSAGCSDGATHTCTGGGGVSTIVPLPSWQSGIAGMLTTGRNQPDISLPFFPVSVYTGGQWAEYLGTSWSSPASVALFIEADQLHGSRLGWLNPTIYSLFSQTAYSAYFTPCTSGSNGAYSCNATQYNQAAGIGAPKGWALANAL